MEKPESSITDAEARKAAATEKLIKGAALGVQNLLVMRHGDRIDIQDPSWERTAPRPWDPYLTDTGFRRARSVGRRFRRQGFNVTRIVVSPFLRCIQTACEVITALCALDTELEERTLVTSEVPIDPSKVKVSIEYGLCEVMNSLAIRAPSMPPGSPSTLDLKNREGLLPAGTLDVTVKKIMTELPKWQESLEAAYWRYVRTFEALADMFPTETVLCVTHGEGVGVSVSHVRPVTVYEVQYCAVSHLRRPIFKYESPPEAGKFESISESGEESGVRFSER